MTVCLLLNFHTERHYAESHYAGCRYAGCRYAGCRYAGCRYAGTYYTECRGVFMSKVVISMVCQCL